MALGIPGHRGKALLVFPRKGACLSHQWTAQGCLACLQKRPVCDSDIISVPVYSCGTMKGTMKCPKGQFPCPQESANYLCSNLPFHPFLLFSFISKHKCVCITCAFVTCLSVWVFVSMYFCVKDFVIVCSVVLPRVSHNAFCASSQKSAVFVELEHRTQPTL